MGAPGHGHMNHHVAPKDFIEAIDRAEGRVCAEAA